MPDTMGRSRVVVVTGIPADVDNWVYRRFINADMPSNEITFVAYDEAGKLDEAQLQAVKAYAGKMVRDVGDRIRHLMGSEWPAITESPMAALAFGGALGSMRDTVVRVADEEKRKRYDDSMRKQPEFERRHAQLDLPNNREVTNRKARRAAAAKKRRHADGY